MGKPSSMCSRKSSASSLRSCASTRMSSSKQVNVTKRKMTKKNKKIKKLFAQLRASQSVIELDESNETQNRKRISSELNMNRTDNSGSIIIIDNEGSTATPLKKQSMHSSTPIGGTRGKNKTSNLSDLNLSVIKNSKNNNHMAENFNREVSNLTADIETGIPTEYNTVDLTGEVDPTVIDLNVTTDSDVILVASNTSLNSSCDSQVTIVERPKTMVSEERKIRRVAKGLTGLIGALDSSSQGKLLEMIAANIFNGCKVIQPQIPIATRFHAKPEDNYLRDMFLGESSASNTSVGSNIYNLNKNAKRTGPRTVVIDGSNVAMEHGRGREFSVKGLRICIDYFIKKGHEVRAFVPRFRCKFGKSTDPRLLDALERSGVVVYTPSREVQGRQITSYDDRYIVQYATAVDGVIVSGDNYRDLAAENPRWRRTIEQRLLPFTWVQDLIMFPRDPLGRNGPTLDQFLHH